MKETNRYSAAEAAAGGGLRVAPDAPSTLYFRISLP
jgi:hypothetical protein